MRKHMDAIILSVCVAMTAVALTLMATGVWSWSTGGNW